MTKILVHNWDAWCAYKASPAFAPDCRVLTTEPTVLGGLEGIVPVQDISASLDTDELNRVGEAVADIALAWRDRIDSACSEQLDGVRAGLMLGEHLQLLVSSLTFRYAAMRRFCSEGQPALVACVAGDAARAQDIAAPAALYDPKLNEYEALARHLSDQAGVALLELASVRATAPARLRQDDPGAGRMLPLLGALGDRILWRSSVPTHPLGDQLFKHVLSGGEVRGFSRARRADRCLILSNRPNPALTRVLPRMLLAGWRIAGIPGLVSADTGARIALPGLEDALIACLGDLPHWARWVEPALRVAARRTAAYLEGTLLPFAKRAVPEVRSHLDRVKGRDATVFASNGLFAPTSCMVAAIYRAQGIPVVMYQHGTLGLSRSFETSSKFREFLHSDTFVLFSSYEKDFIRQHVDNCNARLVPHGSDWIQKPPAPSIARWLTRSRWGCPANRRCIVFAPSSIDEEDISLPHHFLRGAYFRRLKELVEDAFGRVTGDVFIKIRKKGVSPRDTSSKNLHKFDPIELLDRPDNVHVRHWPDLRICRNAADIVIVDRGHSTPGMALHSDRPLVYLEHPYDPLVPEVATLMRDAAFLVRSDEAGWQERLVGILNMPDEELAAAWKAKEPARRRLRDDYVLGTQGSTRSMINLIAAAAPARGRRRTSRLADEAVL